MTTSFIGTSTSDDRDPLSVDTGGKGPVQPWLPYLALPVQWTGHRLRRGSLVRKWSDELVNLSTFEASDTVSREITNRLACSSRRGYNHAAAPPRNRGLVRFCFYHSISALTCHYFIALTHYCYSIAQFTHMASLISIGRIVSVNFWSVVTALVCIVVSTVVANVLQQILFRKRNEPPVVFHWLPIIGSTVTYGIDPFKFIFQCKAKVCKHNTK